MCFYVSKRILISFFVVDFFARAASLITDNTYFSDNSRKMAYTVSQLNRVVWILSAIGIILCIYTYVVETRKEEDSSYEAMCDINEHISCTRVFTSKYVKLFSAFYQF